jgi:murein DD-endopeptidase MepM/ murein hydrolase activator NlpD
VAAAADGKIVEISKCHVKVAHANGWVSEYQHLANIQVKLGDVVARNQKLAVIANALSQPVCPGSEPPDIPHLHFTLRPNMVGATFVGWEFRYNWFWNSTTFRKNGQTLGLNKPLLNVFDTQPLPTATAVSTNTPGNQPSPTAVLTNTPGNQPSATPTIVGPYIST